MAIYWRNGWASARKTIQGIEYRKALGTRSKREAEAAYNKWAAELQGETGTQADRRVSFRKAVDTFTEHHLGTLKRNSQIRYLQSLLNLTEHFERQPLSAIGRGDLTEYVSKRRKAGVADPTIIRDLACLSSVFTICQDWELIDINPVLPFLRAQKRRQQLVNSQERTRNLSHAEELALLTQAAQEARQATTARKREKWRIAAALIGYLDTGMRAQELLSMRWTWVNLGRLEITIPADETKGDKERVIPILSRFARVLSALEKNRHTDLVFWRTEGGRGFADLNHTLQRIAAKAGVSDVTIHDLRRTCGCRLLQDHKAEMVVVQKWLGHASIVTTERVYAFLKVENLHEAVGTRREYEDLKPKLACVDAELGPHPARKGKNTGTLLRTCDSKLLTGNT